MLLLDLSNCGPSGILRAVYFAKLLLNIVLTVIPIILIILLLIDFSKMTISNDEAIQKKASQLAIKRIFSAVLVFFVPNIVSIFSSILGDLGVDYSICYNDLTLEAIDMLEEDERVAKEAEEIARLARIEEEMDKEGYYVLDAVEGEGCDGLVYYETGIFYRPTGDYKNGTSETKGSAPYGYNIYFYNMLKRFVDAGKEAGHTINMSTGDGAWRSYERQEYFYNCYVTKSCNNGNEAAYPGTSNHGWGIASDLSYGNKEAIDWAHANAEKFGLHFSVCKSYPDNCSENWHIDPIVEKSDNSVVERCKK